MRTTGLLGRAVALALAMLAPAASLRAAEAVTIGTVGSASANLWPVFIGLNKGMFAEKDIKTLTTPEKVDLMRIVTAGDYADMLEFGGYNFYRVGITPDGKWKFFTSGE